MTSGYRPGGYWRIDDRTGFKVRAHDTVREWNGRIVHRDEYEERHPQDFVRGRTDKQTVEDARPEPTPLMLGTGAEFLVEKEISQMFRVYQEYVGGTNGQFRAHSGFDGTITVGDLG